MATIVTLDSSLKSYTVVTTSRDHNDTLITSSFSYPTSESQIKLVVDSLGNKICYLEYHDQVVATVYSLPPTPQDIGNSIFGSNLPDIAFNNGVTTGGIGTGGGSGGGGGGGTAQLTSIDNKIPTSFAADLTAIKNNTAKISQFGYEIAQDTAGTVLLIKTDTVLGTSTIINPITGLSYTPVGALELTDPIAAQVAVETNEYEALTTNAGNWVIGEILERLRIINTTTGVATSTNWYNAAGTKLVTLPVIGTDAIDSDRSMLTALNTIATENKYAYNLASDANNVTFVVRTDVVTGAGAYFNILTGLTYTPIAPIMVSSVQLHVQNYTWEALTTNAGNWVIGDILQSSRIYSSITGVIQATFWFKNDGTALVAVPVIGTDVIRYERSNLTAIKSIDAKTSQFDYALASDNANTPFLIKTDRVTGISTYVNTTTGATVVPALPIRSTPLQLSDQSTFFQTSTASAGNWAVSDVLERVKLVIPTTGAVQATFWYKPDGTLIGATPIVGIDVTQVDRVVLDKLTQLELKLTLSPSNQAPPPTANALNVVLRSSGGTVIGSSGSGVSPSEYALPPNARIRTLHFTNLNNSVLYIQIHSSAVALTSGVTPLGSGLSFRVPANSSVIEGVGTFSENGRAFFTNMRVAISTTPFVFTQPTAPILLLTGLSVEYGL